MVASNVESIGDADYQALASFRFALRRFLRFSEEQAGGEGLTPQQHQALLAIRAAPGRALLVGGLAEQLLLRPHSATGLVDRLVALDLVRRDSGDDRRQVTIRLTDKAEAILERLSAAHREELRRIRPLLTELIERL